MSNQIVKFKDLSGNIQSMDFDPAFGLIVELNSDTIEWDFTEGDPINLPVTVKHIGGRPNNRG